MSSKYESSTAVGKSLSLIVLRCSSIRPKFWEVSYHMFQEISKLHFEAVTCDVDDHDRLNS
jgi:hypothetical protein